MKLRRKTKKQEPAVTSTFYGGENTIHQSGTIDIDVDEYGHVVRVWFRCRTLPFRVSILDEHGNRRKTGYGSTDELGFIDGLEIFYRDR